MSKSNKQFGKIQSSQAIKENISLIIRFSRNFVCQKIHRGWGGLFKLWWVKYRCASCVDFQVSLEHNDKILDAVKMYEKVAEFYEHNGEFIQARRNQLAAQELNSIRIRLKR